MLKILTKYAVLNTEIDQGWSTGRSHRPIDHQVSLGRSPTWFCIGLTRYIKRTLFNQYSRNYIKIIHQLIGHVHSLVPLVMADHRLAWQIIAWQSWFRRNRHFAFCLCIKGDGATVFAHVILNFLAHDIVFVTLLPTGRSRVIKKFSGRSQSKTRWPPMK